MRFHVVSLPHTQTTKAYLACAYTEKVRKFCNMMTDLGHEVILYASEDNEARVAELVTCITKAQQRKLGFAGPADYLKIDFNAAEPWATFNTKAAKEIKKRIQPRDFICVITSYPVRAVTDAFPQNMTVEFGIGYSATTSPYRVFESYAWMHFVYGKELSDGHFYDAVIPNYFEVADFPPHAKAADPDQQYFLFVGRVNANKGLSIAQDVCARLGKRLVVAGPGEFFGYGEYEGVVDPQKRGRLMAGAEALFAPTIYVGPFEGVHVEAMLCGTPVITTDWGAFTETFENGVHGFRCHSLAEFMQAAKDVEKLDRKAIRKYAQSRYSTEVVAKQYEKYFERLLTLWGAGFYEMGDPSSERISAS